MTNSITIILILALLLLAAITLILIGQLRKVRRRAEAFMKLIDKVNNLLTSVKWHSEMVQSKEHGKLTIAQEEFMDKVNTGVGETLELLESEFKVSRKEIGDAKKE